MVESAAPHGATVRKGDVLLKLETEKLDRAIADLRADLKISGAGDPPRPAPVAGPRKAVPLDLEASRRAARVAEEDRQFFFDVASPFAMRAIDFKLKMAKEHWNTRRKSCTSWRRCTRPTTSPRRPRRSC